jgi:hypothetical protein
MEERDDIKEWKKGKEEMKERKEGNGRKGCHKGMGGRDGRKG